jgi:hypothetical protein
MNTNPYNPENLVLPEGGKCLVTGKPPYASPAPQTAEPFALFYKADSTLGQYSAEGIRRGNLGGSRGPRSHSIPLAIFAAANLEYKDAPAKGKETEAQRVEREVNNAKVMVRSYLANETGEIEGKPGQKKTLTDQELADLAKKKKVDTSNIVQFLQFVRDNQVQEIGGTKPVTAPLIELAAKHPDKAASVEMKTLNDVIDRVAAQLRDSVRLVAVDGPHAATNGTTAAA